MNRKFFITLSLTSALLTTMHPCMAMEKGDDDVPHHTIYIKEDPNNYIITLAQQSRKLYEKADKMKDSQEKANSFHEVITFLEPHMPTLLNINDPLTTETFTQLIACSLRSQGIVLHNLTRLYPTTPMQKQVDLLKDAVKVMRESHKTYSNLCPTQENQTEAFTTRSHLSIILSQLGLGYSLCANTEKDPIKIIDLHLAALSCGNESYKLKKIQEQEDEVKVQLMLALRQSLLIHNKIASNITIFQEPDTYQKYTTLTKNIDCLDKLVTLFTQYLLNSPIKINWYTTRELPSQKKQSQIKATNTFTITPAAFKGLPAVLSQETHTLLLWSTYCGTLKGASNTILNVKGVNDQITAMYKSKGQEHLDLALKTYREKIYKDEYKNTPEKEQEFIIARLESLAENQTPLNDFYAKLHQDHKERRERAIAQMIRQEKQERQRHKEIKQKREAEERRIAEELIAKQQALKLQKEGASSVEFSASFEKQILEIPNSSIEPEIENCVQKKSKVKKRPDETHPPFIPIIEKEKNIIVPQPKVIMLSPQDYYVFECLTGKVYDRNITQKNVIDLLEKKKGFNCKITNASGGGSHRKATAPNNKVWTIPPAWEGPIPTPYRQELMEFLLIDMGILEGVLEVQARK
ncbi:MAG: hypothetical protein H0X26_02075 [Alphaproteobacteria bacterium]|nr:hypothetical protein [Alphaproteobacteria bacterium]